MRIISASEFSLLEDQARQLELDPSLELDTEKAKLAIATLWDFPSWEALQSSVREDIDEGSIQPSTLVRTPGFSPHPETTAVVLRQAGRIINQMQLFPKLSEKVGEAIPRLYGYESMNALSKASPPSLESTTGEALSPRKASNDEHTFEPAPSQAFTGSGQAGITLVVGGEDDRPLAFTLKEAISRSAQAPIRIFLSDSKAQGFRLAFKSDKVTIETAPTIAELRDSLMNYLLVNDSALAILSLEGFPERADSGEVFSELSAFLKNHNTGHLMVVAVPLRSAPIALWKEAKYQVLLSQSLAGYPEGRNPLNLSPEVFSQVLGFTSNRARDFTYLLLEGTRNGQLISSGVEKLRPASYSNSRQCSA